MIRITSPMNLVDQIFWNKSNKKKFNHF